MPFPMLSNSFWNTLIAIGVLFDLVEIARMVRWALEIWR